MQHNFLGSLPWMNICVYFPNAALSRKTSISVTNTASLLLGLPCDKCHLNSSNPYHSPGRYKPQWLWLTNRRGIWVTAVNTEQQDCPGSSAYKLYTCSSWGGVAMQGRLSPSCVIFQITMLHLCSQKQHLFGNQSWASKPPVVAWEYFLMWNPECFLNPLPISS